MNKRNESMLQGELDEMDHKLAVARERAPRTWQLYEDALALSVPESRRNAYEYMLLSLGYYANSGHEATLDEEASTRAYMASIAKGEPR
jgi:hypothetical protein